MDTGLGGEFDESRRLSSRWPLAPKRACLSPELSCPWECSRPEYWSGLPLDLPEPGIEPRSSALQAGSEPSKLEAFLGGKSVQK